MADSVVWAPMKSPTAWVPRVWKGFRKWDKDGPVAGPVEPPTAPLITYRWRGLRLQCVTCDGTK
jgi:hypothetical protein